MVAPVTLAPGGAAETELRLSVFVDGRLGRTGTRRVGPGAPPELERAASPRPSYWPF